jgi:hypothetical protein
MEEDMDWHRWFYMFHVRVRQLVASTAASEAELARVKDTMLEEPARRVGLIAAKLGMHLKIRFSRSAIAYHLVETVCLSPAEVERILKLSDSARSKFKDYVRKNKMPEGYVSRAQLEARCQADALQAYEDLLSEIDARFGLPVKES